MVRAFKQLLWPRFVSSCHFLHIVLFETGSPTLSLLLVGNFPYKISYYLFLLKKTNYIIIVIIIIIIIIIIITLGLTNQQTLP